MGKQMKESVRIVADNSEEAIYLRLEISDPDTVEVLGQIDEQERNKYAAKALIIGVAALEAATKQAEAVKLRDIGNQHLDKLEAFLASHEETVQGSIADTLKSYFDPKNGQFTDRVNRLVSNDGELETIITKQIEGAGSPLHLTLDNFIGPKSDFYKSLDPNNAESVVTKIREHVEEITHDHKGAILKEFSLDDDESAISRLVKTIKTQQDGLKEDVESKVDDVTNLFSLDDAESPFAHLMGQFSLDNTEGALSRLKSEITFVLEKEAKENLEFREKVISELAIMVSKKQTEEKTTLQGISFEDDVIAFVSDRVGAEHLVEGVGNTTGMVKNSKKGDFVITLGQDSIAAGRKIVGEVKSDQSYNWSRAQEELAEAKTNRQAEVGVFVFASDKSPDDLNGLRREGKDVFVEWNRNDDSLDAYLEASILLALAMCTQESVSSDREDVDLDGFEKTINNIQSNINDISKIDHQVGSIDSATAKILERTRILKNNLKRENGKLNALLDGLRVT